MTGSPTMEQKKLPVSASREKLAANNRNYTMTHGDSAHEQETRSEERTYMLVTVLTEQSGGATAPKEPRLESNNGNITPQTQQYPIIFPNATLNQGFYQPSVLTNEMTTYALFSAPLSPVATPPDTSKPKRHQVKNACVNCQKACKKCDDSRPCNRCIKGKMTDTCKSSIRKERKKGIKRGPYKKRGRIVADPKDIIASSTNITSTGAITLLSMARHLVIPAIPSITVPNPTGGVTPYVLCFPQTMTIKQKQDHQKPTTANNMEKQEKTLSSSKEKSPDRSSLLSSPQQNQQLNSEMIDENKNNGSRLTLLSQVCSDMLDKTDKKESLSPLSHSSQTTRISMLSFTSTTQTDDHEKATDRLQVASTSHHVDLPVRQECEIMKGSSEENLIRFSNENIRQETGTRTQYMPTNQTQSTQVQSINNSNNFSQTPSQLYSNHQDHQQQRYQQRIQQETQAYTFRPTLTILQPSNHQQQAPAQHNFSVNDSTSK
ncbi:819_t:CDS:2 [Ambispora leptoticha]|uniref:819_t:CDS:1 n=1 Tax=Ambispora leptoticha TaxID=144679 RepID=A0A9N8V9X2_9GLOM|nr:819_t:CDS:2 [Ambispora leptoticha]